MKHLDNKSARSLYNFFSGENCQGSSADNPAESNCTQQARNFLLNLANGSCSKLAEQLAGPNLVLVWLLQSLGAPVWMLGALMPIKQTGTLLPQMAAAGQIRRLAVRKWIWVASGLLQAVCLGAIIAAALVLDPIKAGWAILLLFTLFCLASGTASVAFQDVMGKTIAKGRRGRLLASRSMVGGVLTMASGLWIRSSMGSASSIGSILTLIGCAAILWTVAAGVFAATLEEHGETGDKRHIWHEARVGFDFARRYKGFRHYIYVRALLLSVEIASPFFILFAGTRLDFGPAAMGYLILAVGFSQVLSSPFWGKLADNTSKSVMLYSAMMGMAAAWLTLMLPLLPQGFLQLGGFICVFILLGLAEAGVRLGRKTYLVDALPADERPTYTGLQQYPGGMRGHGQYRTGSRGPGLRRWDHPCPYGSVRTWGRPDMH